MPLLTLVYFTEELRKEVCCASVLQSLSTAYEATKPKNNYFSQMDYTVLVATVTTLLANLCIVGTL